MDELISSITSVSPETLFIVVGVAFAIMVVTSVLRISKDVSTFFESTRSNQPRTVLGFAFVVIAYTIGRIVRLLRGPSSRRSTRA